MMSSLDRILPFLGPVADLFTDLDVTEVMVNHGGRDVYVERRGLLEHIPGLHLAANYLDFACRQIARDCDDDVSDTRPILDARLDDGSRVAVLMPPCSVDGTTLTIRRFPRTLSWSDLCIDGTVPTSARTVLCDAINARQNILIAGATNTGKSTLLAALASLFPDTARVVVIEETTEIQLQKPHVIRFEARRAQHSTGPADPGVPAVDLGELVRASLRHRPDRLVLGEVRGPEAFDLLQLLNTGHAGSLSTIHANSAEQALAKLAHCVLMGQPTFPYPAIRESIAHAIHLVVYMSRDEHRRRIADILAVTGYDLHTNTFLTSRQFPA